jgi:hypothetical protein
LSRDRRIITRKRNKLTIVAVAGALSVATAASAVAAVWPSGGTSVGKAGAAFATVNQPVHRSADHQASSSMARQAPPVANQTPQVANQAAAHSQAAASHQARLTALARDQAASRRAAAAQAAKRQAAARQAAAQQTAQKAAAASATPSTSRSTAPTATPAPAPSGSAQAIAQSMLKSFGWLSSQFSCLEPLWAHESSWSVSASNPSTGAYGIPQAAPGSKMASAGSDWQTNASTQIKWGLGYIKGTYGSPCAAWSHEQADGWY